MGSSDGGADDDEFVLPPLGSIVRHLVVGLAAVFGVVFLLGTLLREPLEHYSQLIVGKLGLGGVFVGVVLLDATPFLSHEPILVASYLAHYPLVPLGGVLAAGSLVAACVNWVLGRFLGNRIPPLQRLLRRYKVPSFIQKYGAMAIGGGAMLPMPFAIIGWGAGAAGAPFWTVIVGGVVRAVKILFMLAFVHLGWSAAG